jgi:hypothetical protein
MVPESSQEERLREMTWKLVLLLSQSTPYQLMQWAGGAAAEAATDDDVLLSVSVLLGDESQEARHEEGSWAIAALNVRSASASASSSVAEQSAGSMTPAKMSRKRRKRVDMSL